MTQENKNTIISPSVSMDDFSPDQIAIIDELTPGKVARPRRSVGKLAKVVSDSSQVLNIIDDLIDLGLISEYSYFRTLYFELSAEGRSFVADELNRSRVGFYRYRLPDEITTLDHAQMLFSRMWLGGDA